MEEFIKKFMCCPILQYNHFKIEPDENMGYCTSIEKFEKDITSLLKFGYSSISLYQLYLYKINNIDLPNNTFCIIMEGGKLKDAYTYQIISDDILQIPDNIIIPYQCDISSFVSYVYDLFKPDILMLNLGAKYKADIYIYIDDEINISFDDETEKLKKFSLSEIELATVFTYNLLL